MEIFRYSMAQNIGSQIVEKMVGVTRPILKD